jgi:hypothetical protein
MAEMLLEENPSKRLDGPPVILHISAHIGRTAWKNKSIAFMPKKQGMCALYQTFHLVATAQRFGALPPGSVDVGQLGTA